MDHQLILDRYRPLELLGEGGYGSVVLAYDTRMQRRVSIKRLPFPPDASGNPIVPAGLAEARTAALLNHPSIVNTYDWDTDADEAFIVMEYVDGATAGDLLELADGPLTPDEVAAIVEAVADALEHAHANGVLHLDIKPDNVLVDRDGRVKVTDFGVAALSSAAGFAPGEAGTPGYMPPEQVHGEDVDERTDVWALGVLAYELLADANPFYSHSREGAAFKADIVEAPPPSEFEPSLSPALDDVLLTAIAAEPADRYPGVRSLANRLLELLGDARAGRESLAALVAEYLGEADEEGGEPAAPGLWDRLGAVSRPAAAAASAAVAGWLAWAGLLAFDVGVPAHAAAIALVALAALLAPGLGLGAGTLVLAAGIAAAGMVITAFVLFALAALVWWTLGRRGAGMLAVYGAPLLGVGHVSPLAPLLAGFVLPPLPAAGLGAAGALLTLAASAASGAAAPFVAVRPRFLADPWVVASASDAFTDLLSSPAPLAVIAGWTGAAATMSWACRSATRSSALIGTAFGIGMLAGGYLLAEVVSRAVNTSVTWTGAPLLLSLTASSILMVLVVAAGPPTRPEEE